MTVDEVIGSNVHHLMWEKRIKQQRMIDDLGVSRATLHRRLRGEVPWLARDIEAAARILGVAPGRLFAEMDEVTRDYLSRILRRFLPSFRAPRTVLA